MGETISVCMYVYSPFCVGPTCEKDVDECSSPDLNSCRGVKSVCVNTYGGYFCRCEPGYQKGDGDANCTGQFPYYLTGLLRGLCIDRVIRQSIPSDTITIREEEGEGKGGRRRREGG